MAEIEMSIEGMEQLQKKLSDVAGSKSFDETIKEATLKLHNYVKITTPVDTGRARASIWNVIGNKGVRTWGKVGTNVFYYPFIEFGTKKMEARHVTPESSIRILGEGPFAHSITEFKKDMPEIANQIAIGIENTWNKK